ncbi:hypothetical protein OG225_07465 [Nocardia sp. NBC_01377]|uniref:hypothetical protein n=1 Tax=Nocardia TaxID=1817 RepID=UPI001C23947C|nr:hypothetical protein [Nocardia noduli]
MSTIGEYFASTLIRGIDEGVDDPAIVQAMHGTPRDGSLELMTGTQGPVGPAGDSAAPFRWEGDIADQAALTALSAKLTSAHAGKAWRVLTTRALVYWNGTGFDSFTDAFGAAGPDGQVCTVTLGTVDTGAVGSTFQATLVGAAPNLTLNLTVPRGIKGRKGEAGGPGAIRQAPDYTDGTHLDRAVPVWNSGTQKWVPRAYPGLRGPWSIVENQAWDGGAGFVASQSGITTATKTVAQLNIPAQDTAWRPMISGGVVVRSVENSDQFTTRIDAEVRIGSATGQLVALGAGAVTGATTRARFQPYYGVRGLTPDSTTGVIGAGQPATLFVVLQRNSGGSANYDYTMAGSQIMCTARPVGAV